MRLVIVLVFVYLLSYWYLNKNYNKYNLLCFCKDSYTVSPHHQCTTLFPLCYQWRATICSISPIEGACSYVWRNPKSQHYLFSYSMFNWLSEHYIHLRNQSKWLLLMFQWHLSARTLSSLKWQWLVQYKRNIHLTNLCLAIGEKKCLPTARSSWKSPVTASTLE